MLGPCAGGETLSMRSVFLVVASLSAGMVSSLQYVYARDAAQEPVRFEIPAQPLADALDSYSAAAGVDVFYNARVAEGRRSRGVTGTYTAYQAIELMLEGSGFVARATTPGALAIVSRNNDQVRSAARSGPDARYEPYFSSMQGRLDEVLCALPRDSGESGDVLLRIWLQPSGFVSHAEALGDGRRPDERLAAAIGRARFAVPPAGMPQPVTLVVFRSSPGIDPHCGTMQGQAMQ